MVVKRHPVGTCACHDAVREGTEGDGEDQDKAHLKWLGKISAFRSCLTQILNEAWDKTLIISWSPLFQH